MQRDFEKYPSASGKGVRRAGMQRDQQDFRSLVNSRRKNVVVQSAADSYLRVSLPEESSIMLRKESLSGREQSPEKEESNLSAMRVPGQREVYPAADINGKELRTM